MNTVQYYTLQKSYEDARQAAWGYIQANWATPTWKSIPAQHKLALCFPNSIGMYNGNLCTEEGANTMRRAVIWLNRPRNPFQ